jgi:hypothetical protein
MNVKSIYNNKVKCIQNIDSTNKTKFTTKMKSTNN